jgi:hypothetical protein
MPLDYEPNAPRRRRNRSLQYLFLAVGVLAAIVSYLAIAWHKDSVRFATPPPRQITINPMPRIGHHYRPATTNLAKP